MEYIHVTQPHVQLPSLNTPSPRPSTFHIGSQPSEHSQDLLMKKQNRWGSDFHHSIEVVPSLYPRVLSLRLHNPRRICVDSRDIAQQRNIAQSFPLTSNPNPACSQEQVTHHRGLDSTFDSIPSEIHTCSPMVIRYDGHPISSIHHSCQHLELLFPLLDLNVQPHNKVHGVSFQQFKTLLLLLGFGFALF